ncbi:MAG: oxidoreductase [Spirochaetaceae bacterium]|nr:MAG: oxidoreductase [Spirochaetaceae bacterium]
MSTAAPRGRGVTHAVELVRDLGADTFVIRLQRNQLAFQPGQYITVGLPGETDAREYSIYSAPEDDYLEILVKRVDGGYISPRLRRVQPAQLLNVDGPFGFFTIAETERLASRFYFVATGTGIAPFHSFTRAYPAIDYTLLHGVRHTSERYEMYSYDRSRYVACISRRRDGDFTGRVTDWLRRYPVQPDALCYLCGNCDMIYEAFDILKDHGVPAERLFAEVYF